MKRSAKGSCTNKFEFGGTVTLTPALSHRMREGESSSVGRRIPPLWKLPETGLAVPSPVGRERLRVRDVWFEIRLLSDTCFCTNPKRSWAPPPNTPLLRPLSAMHRFYLPPANASSS